MKFTNTYTSKDLIPVYNTGKATLFKFATTSKEEGDIVLNIWLPNWAFVNSKKIYDILENKKEKLVEVSLQIIEDFNYRVFNEDLNINKTITLDELLKL